MDTALERSQDRLRRIGQTAIASLLAQAINVASGLITVPITLPYLGPDGFGLWMTLTGFVAFLSFTDLGFGIGLQNALTICDGRGDKDEPVALVSTAMAFLFFVFIFLSCFALFVLPSVPLESLIKVSTPESRQNLLPTAQAVIITFAFGLLTGLIQRILNAYQKGFVANMLLSIGRTFGLLAIFVCVWFNLSLPIMVTVYMGMPFLVLGVSSVYIFQKTPWLRPRFRAVQINMFRKLGGVGLLAFGAQLGSTLMTSGPLLVLANRFGTEQVVPFSVTQRLLSTAGLLLTMALTPLWPAYGEAYARGDVAWVRETFRKSIWFAACIALPIFVFSIFVGRPLIAFWTGSQLAVPGWSLLMACNTFALLLAWQRVCAMFLNGLNQMMGQAIYGVLFPAISIFAGFVLAKLLNVGEIVWVFVIVGELFVCFGLSFESRFTILKKLS